MNSNRTWAELRQAVIDWASARNFFGEGGATFDGQLKKLCEEYGELALGLARADQDEIDDAIGDCLVVLIILDRLNLSNTTVVLPFGALIDFVAEITGIGNMNKAHRTVTIVMLLNCMVQWADDFASDSHNYPNNSTYCLAVAYEQIKDRTGRFIDGVFVKDQ